MWPRRKSPLYTPERVERLRQFSDLLVEAAVLRRQRVDLVNRLGPLAEDPDLQQKIGALIKEAEEAYSGHIISVSLMDDEVDNRVACNYETLKVLTPWKETFCQYTVASGKPFEVTDSLKDLIVCRSPHAEQVRSYSGAPIIVRTWVVGVVCLYSSHSREEWAPTDQVRVARWASTIAALLEIELSRQP